MSDSSASDHNTIGKDEFEVVSIFDSRFDNERKGFIKSFLTVMSLGTLFMFLVLPIYWGTYYRQEENLYRLKIAILDLDSPACALLSQTAALGPALLQAVKTSNTGSKFHLGWEVIDNTQFDLSEGVGGEVRSLNSANYAYDVIANEDYYGIIIANSNATLSAIKAFNSSLTNTTSTTSYSGAGAITMYFSEARNFDTADQWISPGMTELVSKTLPLAGSSFSKAQLSKLSSNELASANKTMMANIVSIPFGSTLFNVHPLSNFAGIAATTIGQIYLLIFTYFISLFWLFSRGPIQSKLSISSLITLRLFVPVFQYVFVSLSISLISIAFGVPYSGAGAYGNGGFILFWISNFMTMYAVGMVMEIALALLGVQFTAFFLIFWIILNISTAFNDIGDMANFYKYGYIMPVWNGVSAAKSILFGTKNHLAQNLGVNLGWIIVGSSLLAYIVFYQRKKEIKKVISEKKQ